VTAFHEASHAAVAWKFKVPIEFVSIRPTQHFAGVVTHPSRRISSNGYHGQPVFFWPAKDRRAIEARVAIYLAGTFAELGGPAHGSPPLRRGPGGRDTGSTGAGRTDAPGARTPSGDRGSQPRPPRSDLEAAWNVAREAAHLEAGAFLFYMEKAVRRMVHGRPMARAIKRLADVLLVRDVIPGRVARAVLADWRPKGDEFGVLFKATKSVPDADIRAGTVLTTSHPGHRALLGRYPEVFVEVDPSTAWERTEENEV
jgi:hypothetical protein